MVAWCYVKVHKHGKDTVVALCDEHLLGKELEGGGFKLRISYEFYGGSRIPIEQLWEYVDKATVVNAFGEGVVSELAKRIPVVKFAAVTIDGVPHVQILLK